MARYSTVSLFILCVLALAKKHLGAEPPKGEGQYFGAVGCGQSAYKLSGCEFTDPPVPCTVTCTSPCLKERSAKISGTGQYTYDTKICRAASHNDRIPYFASSPTNVTFYRTSDSKKYLPAIQHDIASTVTAKLDDPDEGSFLFSSPYVSDYISDVASMNFRSLYQDKGFVQACFDNGQYKAKSFQYYIPSSPSMTSQRKPSGENWDIAELTWDAPKLQPGGYWCNFLYSIYSNVMSIAMEADADFVPDKLTIRKSFGENVVIRFTPKQPDTKIVWRKDEKAIYTFPNMRRVENTSGFYLEIDDVEIGDGGIYSVEVAHNPAKKGVVRLIVRRCPNGMFGTACDQQCPQCQNGGVCHDVMGTCICAPGFNGDNCEKSCPQDSFGRNCQYKCSFSDSATKSSCKGAVICLPDPFGCQCAPGYTGLACDNQRQDTGKYLGKVGCGQSADQISGCKFTDPPVLCTVTCTSPCSGEGSSPKIYGTGRYSYGSKICRAASHDDRIPYYESSPTNVTFYRTSDTKKYLPTIQHGIASTVYRTLQQPKGSFVFTSPYISENIFDVASMNFMSLYQDKGFIQACVNSGQHIPINFQYYTSSSPRMKSQRHSSGVGDAWALEELTWKAPQLRPGGYWCHFLNKNTYSDVMSIAMAADADFLPDQLTMRTSIGEKVVIRFKPKKLGSKIVVWKKDEQSLYSFPNMRQVVNTSGVYLEIDNVETGDAGIYSVELPKNAAKKGVVRLIVRRCPEGMFGSMCDRQCSQCQNGGVCHDVMGTCICAPGFNGTKCENHCQPDKFGKNCELSCSFSKSATKSTCEGALICLPDPFGCQCAPGYTGMACDKHSA